MDKPCEWCHRDGEHDSYCWFSSKVAKLCVVAAAVLLTGCADPTPEELAARNRLYAVSFGQMAVQEALRDPGSVEWEWKAVNLTSGSLCYIYRARNGFGGMAQGYAVIVDGEIHRKEKIFDKHCQVKGGDYEVY